MLAWKSKPIKQDVTYDDPEAVEKALAQLRQLPPLVTPQEVRFLLELLTGNTANHYADRRTQETPP